MTTNMESDFRSREPQAGNADRGGNVGLLEPPSCEDCRAAGGAYARSAGVERERARQGRRPKPSYMQRILTRPMSSNTRLLIIENLRLIRTADKEIGELQASLRGLPMVAEPQSGKRVRVFGIAAAYLDHARGRFAEESFAAFLDGFQQAAMLECGEIWALQRALEREVLERLAADPGLAPVLLGSLRQIADLSWKELFEAVNGIDRVLRHDPAGAYARMDFESRDRYRAIIAGLTQRSRQSEVEIARTTLLLAQESQTANDRAAVRRSHVGYYLVDRGLKSLEAAIGYRPKLADRVIGTVESSPTTFYLVGIELVTCLLVAAMLTGVNHLTPFFAGLLLLVLPATQAAVSFVNGVATFWLKPRTLPRLDFSKGIPADCTTMIAVPALLLNEAQVRDLVLDLEIRYLANRDGNLFCALLTDCPDAKDKFDERDRLVELCRGLVEKLNRRYPGSPFFLLHRHRIYNQREGHWMGWERKRGKLLDFNRLLRGGFDSFPVKVGNPEVLPRVRYVITLDADTSLPRDSAARLVGAMAHPLNAAVVDPARGLVVEGYGILQPRIGISIHSATRSRLASLYSGETGFDIYTRAVSDVYQDLFGEGIFTGKGIYEVDVLREVLEERFPENALLSHDLIEGAYARAALVSDIELIDDYPSHFSAYNRRKHRWVRGDWQTLRWILERVPDRKLRIAPNPISIISRWKIIDNLRRSLFETSLVILFLGAWLWLPGRAAYWTAAGAALSFLPAYWGLFFAVLRAPIRGPAVRRWTFATWRAFRDANLTAFFTLVFLLHQALISVDAIARSMLRMLVTRRKLLEWETAAEAETARDSEATVDVYLEWTPLLSFAIGLVVWLLRPQALPVALPVLALWAAARPLSAWLNRRPHASTRALHGADVRWLREYGEKMWRFFRDWSTPATNWMIPDYVREDGEAAHRLSPTNLGMLLNARIAAVHLGLLALAEFVLQTRETLCRIAALPKHRGHLWNWYDIATLQPEGSRFVSTVDSGNLAASLWALKQAALAFASEPQTKRGLTPELAIELSNIAALCGQLVSEMDFRFLYEPRRRALSVGFDQDAGRIAASYYDLLASEARIATFVAVAKGDIPQEAWLHLGRAHTSFEGDAVLLSWTGTMFEYLMPWLWMRHYSGTITHHSLRAALRAQREYARHKGVPWGISESACLESDGSYGYGPFGIPQLALKRIDARKLVISPYSSFLAAGVDPEAAVQNLKSMEEFGWAGRYGFYEAIDYTRAGGAPVRSWMAHHQGMSLLAICNLLCDQPLQRYFHAEPYVMATELLLHERMPAGIQPDREEAGIPEPEPIPEAA